MVSIYLGVKSVNVAKESFGSTALSAKRQQEMKNGTLMLIEASQTRKANPNGTSSTGGKRRESPSRKFAKRVWLNEAVKSDCDNRNFWTVERRGRSQSAHRLT